MSARATSKSSLWWTALLHGICLVVTGLVIDWASLQIPPRFHFQFQVLGVYWLIGGVLDWVEGVTGHGLQSRLWTLLSAVVSVVAGALALSQSLQTGFPVPLTGVGAMAAGAIRLVHGRDGTRTWRSVLIGATYVVLGLLVVAMMLAIGGLAGLLMLLLSTWAVVAGLSAILASLPRRRRQKPAHAD